MKVCAEHVNLKYGDTYALQDISAVMGTGLYAVLGQNGSGKSSFFRVLSGAESRFSGTITYDGRRVYDSRMYLGYLPQKPGLFLDYSVIDYLMYIGVLKALRPIVIKRQMDYWLHYFDMTKFANSRIGRLSAGEQQKIGIVQALLNDPDVLILDEPTSSLDLLECRRLLDLLKELSRTKTVLYSTQIISEAEYVAPNLILLDRGKLLYCGAASHIGDNMTQMVWMTKMTGEQYSAISHAGEIGCEKDGDICIVRTLSVKKPCPDSIRVVPGLSDCYAALTAPHRTDV